MKLAVSNIAWERWNDPAVFALLRRFGVTGIEAAPGKFGLDLAHPDEAAVKAVRARLADEGFAVPALQAILFGHPEFKVFDPSTHAAFLSHLRAVARFGALLGAGVLVYGAPKSRQRRGLKWGEAVARAAEFFRAAGEAVAAEGCVIGLEANPVEYQCDFLTNTADLVDFVKTVDSRGVKVHFDVGTVTTNGGDVRGEIRAAAPFVHFHVSAPGLGNVADSPCDLAAAFRELDAVGYADWVSLEMGRSEPELDNLERALEKIRRCG